MERADVITLIADDPTAHGVLDKPKEVWREVFCAVRSVGMRESYEAKSQGLSPTLVFVLTLADDYRNEPRIDYRGERYSVVRTYVNGENGIEITVEKWRDGHAV